MLKSFYKNISINFEVGFHNKKLIYLQKLLDLYIYT